MSAILLHNLKSTDKNNILMFNGASHTRATSAVVCSCHQHLASIFLQIRIFFHFI